jgi:GT2 family glycosyltransferase
MAVSRVSENEKANHNSSVHPPVQVGVVIPAHNRSDLLEQCLASIAEQEFEDGEMEVIVCDDGSTENLAPLVDQFQGKIPRIQLLRQVEARGPAAARNIGFRSSSAGIFVCLDSDIICGPNYFKRMVGALKMNPDWVAAEATLLSRDGSSSILLDAPENRGGTFPSGASAYRSEALERAGGFDEEFLLPACEDADLAARLIQLGQYGYVPEALAYHPARRVSWGTHWRWRKHWRYEMILAKRYGFLSFPGKPAGPYPRLRVAWAAIVTLPAGRFMEGLKEVLKNPRDGVFACLYALFDVFCGIWALPCILLGSVPPQRNYLSNHRADTGRV